MEKRTTTVCLMAEVSNISAPDEPDALELSIGFGSMRVQTDDRDFFDKLAKARENGTQWRQVFPVPIIGKFTIDQTLPDVSSRPQTTLRLVRVMANLSASRPNSSTAFQDI